MCEKGQVGTESADPSNNTASGSEKTTSSGSGGLRLAKRSRPVWSARSDDAATFGCGPDRDRWFSLPMDLLNHREDRQLALRQHSSLRVFHFGSTRTQHLIVLRFFPTLPAFSALVMASKASGTLQEVPPRSTATLPSLRAVTLARFDNGLT